MWRAAILLCAALLVGGSTIARAQEADTQNPREYEDEDSQPLKIASYFVAPVGWALEWGVARPLHYLATSSPLAPLLGANTDKDTEGPLPVAELPPPDVIETSPEPAVDTEIVPRGKTTASPPPPARAPVAAPGSQPAYGNPLPPSANQPVLH